MTTFYLIRHGEKDADDQVMVGRTDGIHLTARGRRQADAIASTLRDVSIAHVVSSPRERARETAEPLAQAHGLHVEVRPAFEELHFGDWTGKTLTELAAVPEWTAFNAFRSAGQPPDGERMITVQDRVVGEMLKLRTEFPNRAVAIVSHGDPIRAALNYFLGSPLDLFHRIEISIGSISVVTLSDREVRILRLNEVPRLKHEV